MWFFCGFGLGSGLGPLLRWKVRVGHTPGLAARGNYPAQIVTGHHPQKFSVPNLNLHRAPES